MDRIGAALIVTGESIANLTPADVWFGRFQVTLKQKGVKHDTFKKPTLASQCASRPK